MNFKSFKRAASAALLCLSIVVPGSAAMASDYPNRPIRFICPYSAGGLTDVLTRLLAKRLSERIGQPVVVENRTGAGGIIAVDGVAKGPADGYTIILVGQGQASVNESLYKKLPYNTLRDFAPISLVSTFSLVFVTNPDQPPKSFSELLAMARAKPGALSYGSAGNASTSHLMTELLKGEAGIDLVHVPYRGEAAAFTEVMGGRLTGIFATVGGARPYIESGKLRALAIATKERNKLLPDVPTVSESGVPGFEVQGWYGVLAPKNVPKEVVDRLSKEFMAMAREPEMREMLASRGMESVGSSPEELTRTIKSETERWAKVVANAKITVD
ncbi:MAG: Bug family tripartite tricarboxylate transporter substrate binding protein [Noviherbaspirillum sp.]